MKFRIYRYSSIILSTLLASSLGCNLMPQDSDTKEAWDGINSPLNFSNSYELTMSKLPLSGKLAKEPWSDSYWPSKKGGIRHQWHGSAILFGSLRSPSLSHLKRMSEKKISRLSPAEKFDALNGNYQYDLGKEERARTSPFESSWHGICHGWAPAAMMFEEPQPVTLTSRDGITISFGSSDVKALLSYYVGQVAKSATRQLGGRCNIDLRKNPEKAFLPECRDTNAGAFHLVLTNELGILKKGFVMDRTRDAQVWNQPVFEYSSSVMKTTMGSSPGAARGTVKELTVRSLVKYTIEIDPQWEALGDNSPFETADYRYVLEINNSDEIIGGRWLTEDRPDFLWAQETPKFSGYFQALSDIYQASISR
jgi:hypothetical protein